MKKLLTILVCLATLLSCNSQNNKTKVAKDVANNQNQAEETQLEMPHIFHGWASDVALAKLNEDGSLQEWGELVPDTTKYAMYLDNGLIVIFDDTTQFHYIEEYLGKQVEEITWCNIATIDQNEKLGYVRFCYQKDNIVDLYLDYPQRAAVYPLISSMPPEELDERLSKYTKQ